MKTKFLAVVIAAFVTTPVAFAADTAWQGGDGSWSDPDKWNNGVPTAENENNAILTLGGTINFGNTAYTIKSVGWMNGGADKPFVFTADSDEAGLTINGEIDIGRVGDGTLTYVRGAYKVNTWIVGCFYNGWGRERPVEGMAAITNSTVTSTGDAHVGTDGGHGTVIIGDGGKLIANSFYVGNAPAYWDPDVYPELKDVIQNSAVGDIVVTNGELSAVYGLNIASGLSATGTVTVVGSGKVTTGQRIQLATASGANGKLFVADGADVLSGWHMYVGGENVADATAYVKQTGGLVTLGGSQNLVVGNGERSIGTYDISGGTLTMPSGRAELGTVSGAKGVLNVSGSAIVTNNSSILIGSVTGAEGELTISGGEFYAQADPILGSRGKGMLTMTGGYMKVAGADSTARWIKMNNEKTEDFTGTSTLNLDGGVIEVQSIMAENTHATAVINCNGGTLKSYLSGDIIKRDGAGITVNLKAGGLIVDVPEGLEATIYVESLHADESLGGIVKRGAGQLFIKGTDGHRELPALGYIRVEGGQLNLWDSAKLTSLDKLYVAANCTNNLQFVDYESPIHVRSLILDGEGDAKGQIVNYPGKIVQVENPPALTKAVWTGARSDDVTDPANWALYYNDGEKDVRVSADELPTVDTTIYWNASIDDALPDLSALTCAKKVLVLPAETVTLTATSATTFEKTYNLSGWHLDASAATLNVVNARMLGTAAVATAITSAGIDGRFANVTSDDGKGGVKVSYGNDGAVGVSRRGGFVIVIQ